MFVIRMVWRGKNSFTLPPRNLPKISLENNLLLFNSNANYMRKMFHGSTDGFDQMDNVHFIVS